jgi:hypothetical protein
MKLKLFVFVFMGIKSFGTEFCAAERVEIYFAKAV